VFQFYTGARVGGRKEVMESPSLLTRERGGRHLWGKKGLGRSAVTRGTEADTLAAMTQKPV